MEQHPVYLCGGNLAQHYERWWNCHPVREQADVDVAPFPGFDAYEETARKYALLQRDNKEMHEGLLQMHKTAANLQREVQKWRELYFASRLQSERGVKLLQDAKELIVKLEDEARKMSN